ncbi:DNA mismatch endonuclease Vsr [Bradyrhizobium diazoefficiens]|nr:very short patch repair endonuclease [Bradyrhizobium diazoefficiens]MBR0847546.1 DNA mismatch endonuclease Vsr [Bradyrhizobium diazoefficiens]
MDNVSRERRSEIMRSIRGKDTGPELALRRLLFGLGYRYRLHAKDLPGSPDLVFRAGRKVIFVHGCFWHGHHCRAGRHPKTRPAYWRERFAKNQRRDIRNVRSLRRLGWSVLTVWECQLSNPLKVIARVQQFLGRPVSERPST